MQTFAIDRLREGVRGEVTLPDDEGYEQARRVYTGGRRRSCGPPTPATSWPR